MLVGLVDRKGRMWGFLSGVALREAVKMAPAEPTAAGVAAAAAAAAVVAVAADTEGTVAQLGMGLPEMVLVVESPATCLVEVGVFGIVDLSMVNTDSERAGEQLEGLAMEWEVAACNK